MIKKTFGEHNVPLIDTVERFQGAEKDVIIFSFTSSEYHRVHSLFLTDPCRFTVAMTRARFKFILIAGQALFSSIPPNEDALEQRKYLLEFWKFCEGHRAIFFE